MKIYDYLKCWDYALSILLGAVFLYGYSMFNKEAIHNQVYVNSYQESLLLYENSVDENTLPNTTQDYFKLIKGNKTWEDSIKEERERARFGKSKNYLAMVQGSFLFLFILLAITMRRLKQKQSNTALKNDADNPGAF